MKLWRKRRLDKKMVRELNSISDEEHVDRTTVIRRLIAGAIENYKKAAVLQKYEQGEGRLQIKLDFQRNVISN